MHVEIVESQDFVILGKTRVEPVKQMVVNLIHRKLNEVKKPTFICCLVFGLALVPIPAIRIGSVELLYLTAIVPSPDGLGIGLALFFLLSFFSLLLIPLFLAWTLPNADRPGLPKRSIGALCLLIVYHPFRYYLDGIFFSIERRAEIVRMHEQFPIVWAFEYLDTFLLLGLAARAVLRHKIIPPKEKMWFHWLLFVCFLWAIFAFIDPLVGISFPIALEESDARIN